MSAVYDRFKKIFSEFGYSKFGKFDGWCPRTTVITVEGESKELLKLVKVLFETEGFKLFLDDKAYHFGFSDLSSYGRHKERLQILEAR